MLYNLKTLFVGITVLNTLLFIILLLILVYKIFIYFMILIYIYAMNFFCCFMVCVRKINF